MTTRQQVGSMLWIGVFCAALTSPFWGDWLFGAGAILMAVAMEMRKEPASTPLRPRAVARKVTPAEGEGSAGS